MAYRQNPDPYYANAPYQQQQQQHPQAPPRNDNYAAYAPPPHPASNTGVANGGYAPQQQSGYRNDQDQWDAKSYSSSYAGSQAHLNPYEMSQVNVGAPPMPPVPYQQQQYPPPQQAGRPPVFRDQSSAGWSVAKEKLMKRRSVKQVQLFRGNLVLDVPVPTHIVPAGKTDEEFNKMRYTAATCDPDEFMASRYSLRQFLWGRQTELFIVMTMYNEDEVLFAKTMNAYVSHLLFYLCDGGWVIVEC